VEEESITVTGNTVIDSLRWILNRIDSDTERKNQLDIKFRSILPFDVCNNRIVLITGHRRENFGEGFIQICEALHDLATSFTDVRFVYPVHLNPNVQDPVRSILGHRPNIHLIEPLDYEPFIYLLRNCYLVLTDSGGIQEEAPNLGKPVLVMRDITERPEAVMAGTVKLVGANKDQIISGVTRLLKEESHYLNMSLAHNPYGDGDACKQIVEIIKRFK
jgi:UDP-N-acetylglucosamine 2-epimerase (non-hydrolysing)